MYKVEDEKKKFNRYKTLHINEVHSVGFEPSTSRLTVRYNDCMTNSQSTYILFLHQLLLIKHKLLEQSVCLYLVLRILEKLTDKHKPCTGKKSLSGRFSLDGGKILHDHFSERTKLNLFLTFPSISHRRLKVDKTDKQNAKKKRQ